MPRVPTHHTITAILNVKRFIMYSTNCRTGGQFILVKRIQIGVDVLSGCMKTPRGRKKALRVPAPSAGQTI
jgi:hypothetical protein